MRQRYWRSNLKDFDKDHTGQLSHAEILTALEETGLDVSPEHVDSFFAEQQKDPKSDELTIEEAMICLEREYGLAAQLKVEEEEAAVNAEVTKDDEAPEITTSPQDFPTMATDDAEVDADVAAVDAVSATIAEEASPESTSPTRPTPRPTRSSMFGHSRESIYDLEMQLRTIFQQHPKAYYQSEEDREIGEAVVPASAILDILETFSEMHEVALLGPEDQATLQNLVEGMAETQIGSDFLIGFLAKATGTDESAMMGIEELEDDADHMVTTPAGTSPKSPGEGLSDQADDEDDTQRGRELTSPSYHSRNSSGESVATSYQMAPETPKASSIFDVRARSTPLEAMAPPSSWSARPLPASKRRKSSTSSIGSRDQSEGEV